MPDEIDHDGSVGDNPVDSVDKSMFDGAESPSQAPSGGPKGADIARAALDAARAAQRDPRAVP